MLSREAELKKILGTLPLAPSQSSEIVFIAKEV